MRIRKGNLYERLKYVIYGCDPYWKATSKRKEILKIRSKEELLTFYLKNKNEQIVIDLFLPKIKMKYYENF